MKKFFILILIALAGAGCSKGFWQARFYMLKAEDRLARAAKLKSQKVSYEERVPYYREACGYYLKAYQNGPGIFTLSRIRDASDSCWRAKDDQGQQVFVQFEEAYAKKHPKEFEYGETDGALPE